MKSIDQIKNLEKMLLRTLI